MRASRLSILFRAVIAAALASLLVLVGATSASAAPATITAPDLSQYVVAPGCDEPGSLSFTANPPAPVPNGFEFLGQGFRVVLDRGFSGPGVYSATVAEIPAGVDPAFPEGSVVVGQTSQTLTVLPAIENQTTDPEAPCYLDARAPVPAPDLTPYIIAPTCTQDGSLAFLNNPPAQNPNGYEFPGQGFRVYISPGFTGPGTYTASIFGIGAGIDPAFPDGTTIVGGPTTQTLSVLPAIGFQSLDPDAPCYLAPEPTAITAPDLSIDVVAPTCTLNGTLTFLNNQPAENPNGYEFLGQGYRVYLSPGYSGPGTYTATVQGIEPGFDPAFPNGTVIVGGPTIQTLDVLPATGFQNTDPTAPCYRVVDVTPSSPTITTGTCAAPDTIVDVPAAIIGVAGYVTQDGTDVTNSTIALRPGQSATVTAVIDAGYQLAPGAAARWSYSGIAPMCATPVPPVVEPATCTDTRTLVQIPEDPGPGVERYVDNATGETLTGTLYLTEGESITINAVLEPGVDLSPGATASWTYEYAGGCPDPGPITGGGSAGSDPDGLASTGPGPVSGLVALTAVLALSGAVLVLLGRESRRMTF